MWLSGPHDVINLLQQDFLLDYNCGSRLLQEVPRSSGGAAMSDAGTPGRVPDPACDWISQRGLAALLGVSERTASLWARAGRLRCYEHGVENNARRPYSRVLVERERQRRWDTAVRSQDERLGSGEM